MISLNKHLTMMYVYNSQFLLHLINLDFDPKEAMDFSHRTAVMFLLIVALLCASRKCEN